MLGFPDYLTHLTTWFIYKNADHLPIIEHNHTHRRNFEFLMHAENSCRRRIALDEVENVRHEYKSYVNALNKT